MKLKVGKKYKTRGGESVRILCTDCKGIFPVIGLLERKGVDDEIIITLNSDGTHRFPENGISEFDIINKGVIK